MPKIVHTVMHLGASEARKFLPVISISCGETASIKFERQGVSFDEFTTEQLRAAAEVLRADEKIRNLVSCIQRTYPEYGLDIADALDRASEDI